MSDRPTILLIAGKYFDKPSRLDLYLPVLSQKFPAAEIISTVWNVPSIRSLILRPKKIIKISHSFGCDTSTLIDQSLWEEDEEYEDDSPLDSEVFDYFIDPVLWTTIENPDDITSMNDSILAQLLDHDPLSLPPNVKRCECFRRSQEFGPATIGVESSNYSEQTLPGTDHDSVVDAAMPLVLSSIEEVLL